MSDNSRCLKADLTPIYCICKLTNSFPSKSAESGEYWRLLIPGYYELVASKEGYSSGSRMISVEQTIDRKEIESKNPTAFEAEIVDFVLDTPNQQDNDIVFDDYVKY